MREFKYTINNKAGIHARPAGMLAKKAKEFESTITIEKDGTSVNLEQLIALMQLEVKCNETVTVNVDGSDEDAAFESIKLLFEENL